MIAYNKTMLDNRSLHGQLDQAMAEDCITAEENSDIRKSYPVSFYSPNIYVRVGLFILTVIILFFSFGLITLITDTIDRLLGAALILYGIGCIALLEYFIRTKMHYRSGVDNALLWTGAGLIFSGLLTILHVPTMSLIWLLVLVISMAAYLRYGDQVMPLPGYCSFIGLLITSMFSAGPRIKALTPFVVMGASILTLMLIRPLLKTRTFRFYKPGLHVIKAAALVSCYLAGNYFIIRELEGMMLHGNSSMAPAPAALQGFWLTTVLVPFIYLYLGLRKKDAILLWCGLLLVAATTITIRYYYAVIPPEMAMLIGGLLLMLIAYGCFRYFRTPRYGISEKQLTGDTTARLESLISLRFGPSGTPASPPIEFGGGSGGGGGAGGSY